jgi:uncharacterized protein (DUF1684 family)
MPGAAFFLGRLSSMDSLLSATLLVLLASPGYEAQVQKWRQDREVRLRSDGGWLSVSGLFFLREGQNRFGSGAGADVRLPSGPAEAGVLELKGKDVTVRIAQGVEARLGGHPVEEATLRSDASGERDVLTLGPLAMQVIERGGRTALRLWDNDNPKRREFKGLRWFPIQEAYQITAKFVPYPPGRTLKVASILGYVEDLPCPGYVSFRLHGKDLRLEPVLEDQELFFIFRDETSGTDTYDSGRFLYADPPVKDSVILDFNKAFTPPCAFTPFATCPLPPRQNRLQAPIEAGEKTPAH